MRRAAFIGLVMSALFGIGCGDTAMAPKSASPAAPTPAAETPSEASDVASEGLKKGHDKVALNGPISELTGDATAFQFVVREQTIRGDEETEFFGHGGRDTFEDLQDDRRVEVKGEQRDGFVYAERIHINFPQDEDDDDPEEPEDEEEFEVEGTIGRLRGACPSLAFKVKGHTISTTDDTTFTNAACGALKNGNKVKVEGTKFADGSMVADSVERKRKN